MLLEDKNALVYGAGGVIGGAVARTFAREGARVFLAGRTKATVDAVAKEIEAAGGRAEAAEVDALDEAAVHAYTYGVHAATGRIDVVFNAIGVAHVQGAPLRELSLEEYSLPIRTYTSTQFLTSVAAARHMVAQGSGVIVTLSTTAARLALPSDGFGVACAGVEALSRQLAGELGPHGVRVVCVRPDGIPETAELGSHSRGVWEQARARMGANFEDQPGATRPLVERGVKVQDVAEVAAFLASDRAGAMTAVVTNLSAGSVVD